MEVVTWAHHITDSFQWVTKRNLWPCDSFCVKLWLFSWSYPLVFSPFISLHAYSAQQAVFKYSRSFQFECLFKPPSKSGNISAMLQCVNNSLFHSELYHNIQPSLIPQIMHKYFTLNSHIVQLFSMMHAVLLEHQEMFLAFLIWIWDMLSVEIKMISIRLKIRL